LETTIFSSIGLVLGLVFCFARLSDFL